MQKGKLRIAEGGRLCFWCPGCKEAHSVINAWTFNGNYERPTFKPSVLVTSGHYSNRFGMPGCWCRFYAEHPELEPVFKCSQCHTFITDGQIQFLADCTHELAGKTVEMEAF